MIIYLDDILIYSKTQEEHDAHVRKVLAKLHEHGLYAKLEKCSFDRDRVEFLGYIVSPEGISMDPTKVKAVLEWDAPKSICNVQFFLGFTNFYHKFFKDYSKIMLPLTQLMQKDQKFEWTTTADHTFKVLKRHWK